MIKAARIARLAPIWIGAALAVSSACGSPPPEAPSAAPPAEAEAEAVTPEPSVENPEPAGDGVGSPTPPAVPSVAALEAAIPPAPSTGLPPVSVGPAVRLTSSLPITSRDVGGRSVPSVTLTNPTAQANLDAWFEHNAWCRGRVQLALDGFVSYHCSYSEPAAGGGVGRAAMTARITETGEVVTMQAADVFVAGTDIRAMVRVWADEPEAEGSEVAFGPAGATVVAGDSDETLQLPWRTIAPYVRNEGPLAAALIAAGLELAAPGAIAPPPPPSTTVLGFADAGALIRAAATLLPEVRAETRVLVGGDDARLYLPPAIDAAALVVPGSSRVRGYAYGALASLATVSTDAAVELHETGGPRTPVTGALPAGAVAVAVVGPIGPRTSTPGTGWVLLGTAGVGGYAQGRHVALASGCGAPATDGSSGYATLTGGTDRFAWTIAPTPDRAHHAVALFMTLGDCTLGAPLFSTEVDHTVTELSLVSATEGGSEILVVLAMAEDLASSTRTIAVYGTGAAPVTHHTSVADAPEIELAARRGPAREAGYFPIVLRASETQTWLTWTGTTLEARAP